MRRTIVALALLVLLFVAPPPSLGAQSGATATETGRKGRLFFTWGYNRAGYSDSDIHFTGPGYDFTLEAVSAADRPTSVTLDNYLNPRRFTIPQWDARLGYFVSDRTVVSFGMSHMKYVVDRSQQVTVTGSISAASSPSFAGEYAGDSLFFDSSFLRFEHTNGLNFWVVEVERFLPLGRLWSDRVAIDITAGGGVGFLTPKSAVALFGARENDAIHLAGYGLNGSAGLYIEFFDRVFVRAQGKGGFMHLPSVLTRDANGPDRASQRFYFVEGLGLIGVNVYRFR